jgi:coenzyme F420-reducing hydrogenase gamma subunit
MQAKKKLKIGWFSFTCSEDSTMIMVELMNDRFFKWRDLLEVRHARVLQDNNKLSDIDVAFVEGAITNDADARKLRSIRKNSKKLVAVGSCAINAFPAGQRNMFDDKTKADIEFLLRRFSQADRVRKVSEVVQVDDMVPGCPMQEDVFLSILDKYLKEFGVSSVQ